eukprot:Pgem_evm1s12171
MGAFPIYVYPPPPAQNGYFSLPLGLSYFEYYSNGQYIRYTGVCVEVALDSGKKLNNDVINDDSFMYMYFKFYDANGIVKTVQNSEKYLVYVSQKESRYYRMCYKFPVNAKTTYKNLIEIEFEFPSNFAYSQAPYDTFVTVADIEFYNIR